jgi:glycosyltransferase involved in cell wall biosynthesis
MKIAFLNLYQNVVNRGAETYVSELSKRLAANNKVVVLGAEGKIKKGIDWSREDATGTLARRLFVDYWSLQIAKFTLSLLPKIFKEKFDVIIPLNGGWQPAFVRIITWLYGGKMIISGQSGMGWDDKNNLWSFPDSFVALSTQAEKWAKKVNPFVKSFYIPNGVDLDKFKSQNLKVKNTNQNLKTILTVGAFTKQKRLDLVVKAVSKLDGVKLLIVGGGGDFRNDLQDLGSKLLGDRLEILSVPFGKMPEIYRSADVFTLPSASSEAFGNVLVEAMASGLPVVATADPIRKEIVGNAGILVDPINTDAYTEALRKALEINWGDKPRKQAEKFSWDRIAKEYEKLFSEFK